jgi:hypothetical protein
MQTLSFQLELCPELPNVYGASDYRIFRDMLIKIDEILIKSGLEHDLISKGLRQYVENHKLDSERFYNSKASAFHYKYLKYALRCNIARHLTAESYRAFSLRLADSNLFQWFASISAFGSRKAVSKSSLERYEKYFDETLLASQIQKWLSGLADNKQAEAIGLTEAIDLKDTWMDSTCLEANIHYPVDWILLRDATRSLLSAIKTIRAQGLKHRMPAPASLMKEMNKLCMEMTHSRRRKGGKKYRKAILRTMKKLVSCVAGHGERYKKLLIESWQVTAWSEAQAKQVIGRLDNILDQLPQAIKQAHDRIIGEREIESCQKILSLYDKDSEVIVRGKAGRETEFGQRLVLTEQSDGLIIDWQLCAKQSLQDNQLLKLTIERLEKNYGSLSSISTDRAFASAKNDTFLETKNIYNATCPRSPAQLQQRLEEPLFVSLQTRRSQTEARIGIFKNVFLGRPLRTRIALNKRHAINWCVLSHNLWVLARKILADEKEQLKKAA